MAELRWGTATDEGQVRTQNEDHAHAGDGLFVVADGMGGHLAGEVASEMTVDTMKEAIAGHDPGPLDALVASIHRANRVVYRSALDNPDQAGMGTTVTALAVVADPVDGEVFGVANVGDSRGYVLRHGRLRQITIDHSFVQELIAEGAISREEARYHPRRNIVTRALGIESVVRVDSWTMPIIRGDRFLLCSDGLVDEVTDDDIAAVLLAHPNDPEAAAQGLVAEANAAGGRDNITVVVVDVLEGDDPPDPTAEFDVVPLWADDDGEDTGETEIIADPPDPEIATAASASAAAGRGVSAPTADRAADPSATEPNPPTKGNRSGRLTRFVLALGVAAVGILGFAILAAWARDGYFVAFDEDDRVAVYQGREGGVLWFEPTVEVYGDFNRDELDPESVELVELTPRFVSLSRAVDFVAERLTPIATPTTEPEPRPAPTTTTVPTDTSTATTTTTTTPPPTPTPTTAVPIGTAEITSATPLPTATTTDG